MGQFCPLLQDLALNFVSGKFGGCVDEANIFALTIIPSVWFASSNGMLQTTILRKRRIPLNCIQLEMMTRKLGGKVR